MVPECIFSAKRRSPSNPSSIGILFHHQAIASSLQRLEALQAGGGSILSRSKQVLLADLRMILKCLELTDFDPAWRWTSIQGRMYSTVNIIEVRDDRKEFLIAKNVSCPYCTQGARDKEGSAQILPKSLAI